VSRTKTTVPAPTRDKGQRSLDLPIYFNRIIPTLNNPIWQNARLWREFVHRQPVALDCREFLISTVLSLDWKIEPYDSEQRDELKNEIKYYTKFFTDTGEYDYSELIECIGKDLLDLPFGGAVELGREGDDPNGRVLWINPLDGGTLYPTLNKEFPVGQKIPELATTEVYFPYYAISRIYMSPRTEIRRWGWGMAPPEKIFLAIEMLNRGDVYYASLLLDTPQVGILDLLDMSKASAENWIESWTSLLGGIDPFKIPVLYEHEKEAKFISFTKNPEEIQFNTAINMYATLTTAGYGISLSDIGFTAGSNGGNTLAGTIREERKTKRTGLARIKRKFTTFFNRILPDELYFKFIDLDDEQSIAMGRARLSDATAWSQYIAQGIFTPEEARLQTISDGLVSISISEKLPEGYIPPQAGTKPAERPSMLGRPIAPSSGGQGEVLQAALESDPEFFDLFSEKEAKFADMTDKEKEETLEEINIYLRQFSAIMLDNNTKNDKI